MGWGHGPLTERKTVSLTLTEAEHKQHKALVEALHKSGRSLRHWFVLTEQAALRELRKGKGA